MPSDAAKGPEWRKGTNYTAWFHSSYWENKDKMKEQLLKKRRCLFLDDMRRPRNAWLWDKKINLLSVCRIPEDKWEIVRSYDQFVSWIDTNGIPDVVSFDNDLYDPMEIDSEDQKMHDLFMMINWEESEIKTGAHCAQYLVDKCKKLCKPIPEYYVHTANSAARPIIHKIMEDAKKSK